MTRRELAAALAAGGIEEAREEAMRLFCHFTGMERAAALAAPETDCPDTALSAALARRMAREPLAYILGEARFCDERYAVSPACLIPRPETEMLVEYARTHLKQGGFFADFCTGSGCIAISLLAARTDCRGDAYDLSEEALALAAENAQANGVEKRLAFHHVDLLRGGVCREKRYDMILSNPPYVARAVIDGLAPELAYEPRMALDGGEDGCDFYAAFLSLYADRLADGASFVFEIGYDQGEAIARLGDAHGFSCSVMRDLGGLDRLAVLKRK